MKNNVRYFNSDDNFNVANIASNVYDGIGILVFVDANNNVDNISIFNNTKYNYYFRENIDVYVVKEPAAKGKLQLNYWMTFFDAMLKYKTEHKIFNKMFLIESIQKLANKNGTYTTIFDIESVS
jgi:hypothetical protein